MEFSFAPLSADREQPMKLYLAMMIILILLIAACSAPGEPDSLDQDNRLLAQILQEPRDESDGYALVAPQTFNLFGAAADAEAIEQSKRFIKQYIAIEGYDIDPLLDEFFRKNKKTVRLSLPSAPEQGYRIDYEESFEKNFAEGHDWEKWRADHPEITGHVHVSLPAYDRENEIVLVYLGILFGPTSGGGQLLALKHNNGKFTKLASLLLWMS
jgi:hypothetical protein